MYTDPIINALLPSLMQTKLVKRLSEISFMGAMEILTLQDSMKAGSRLDHSIGVALLTERICRKLGIDERSIRLAVASAMLHDIGHTVFSHSAEKYLYENFCVDHTDVSIIFMQHDSEIRCALEQYDVDVRDVIAILENDTSRAIEKCLFDLFRQPINPDTIEGIYRAQRFFEPSCATYFPNPSPYFSSVSSKDFLHEADNFWITKNHIYREYITDENYARFDRYLTFFLAEEDVKLEDLFLVDKCFEAKFREFLDVMFRDRQIDLAEKDVTGRRNYCIYDVKINEMRDLKQRYKVEYQSGSRVKWRQNLSSVQKNVREKSYKKLEQLVKEKSLATSP